MDKYDVIVVGSGLGGLISGARLAKKGLRVCLLEQHNIVGGYATVFKRKDFTIEASLHEMDGLNDEDFKIAIFNELGVFDNVEFVRVPEFYRFLHGKTDIVILDNIEEAKATLEREFPEEKRGIKKFFKKIIGIRKEISNLPSSSWQFILMLPVAPILFPNLVFGSNKSLGDYLDSIIKNEELKLILQANLSYYHDDPYTMSLIYFSVAQSSYYLGGGHFIKGGSQELSNYLAKVILDNDGEILLNSKVEKIIVEDGEAKGVEFQNTKGNDKIKQLLYARRIIMNGAVPNVNKLLEDEKINIFNRDISKYKVSSSISTVYLGFKKPVKDLGNPCYSTFLYDEKIKTLKDIQAINKSKNFDDKIITFVDYSQIDSGLAPAGKSVGSIALVDYMSNWKDLNRDEYKRQKEKIANILVNRLEKIVPNIREQIEYVEVATPKTNEKYTLNPEGTPYGYAQISSQSGNNRLPNKSSIKDLYFASAWVNPGGGFSGAIISGWFCADNIIDDIMNKK